ncbi:MAG: outer membrane beta-barrel protein [Gemmatimonadota bacterium]|nr:outer membrane beta-barrel protein [Gemmatimonadota bacterium]
MKRVFLAVAALAFAGVAQAQGAMSSSSGSGVALSLGAGGTFLTGNGASGLNTGWNAMGAVGFDVAMIPFGLRVDALYNSFGVKGTGGGTVHSFGGNLNAMFAFPMEGSGFSPYVTGGVGFANLGGGGGTSTTKFAYNVGGGVKVGLAGFDVFAEARFNSVLTDNQSFNMIPITVGVTFRP